VPGLQIPPPPQQLRLSELLYGDNVGFIINAYLAIQHQWPDNGGFDHYRYVLDLQPASRPRVLWELASSEGCRLVGSHPVIDLDPEQPFDPEQADTEAGRSIYAAMSQRLRMWRVVADVGQMQRSMRSLVGEHISAAVARAIDAGQASMAMLESRVESLNREVRVLQQGMAEMMRQLGDNAAPVLVAGPDAEPALGPAAAALAESRSNLLMLAARVMALEYQLDGLDPAEQNRVRGEVDGTRQAISALSDVLHPLHHFVSYDLKRQMAEFVNAYVQAQLDIHVIKPREGVGASRPQQSHG